MLDKARKDRQKAVEFAKPKKKDAAGIWDLVKESPPLELNSFYSYLLLCTHYPDTCVVGRAGREVVSFLSAYYPPKKLNTLFIWQIAVERQLQGSGVAYEMVKHLLYRQSTRPIKYIEATVTPSNEKSLAFFQKLAEKLDVSHSQKTFFTEKDFSRDDHEAETLITLGPIMTEKMQKLIVSPSGLKVFKKMESKVRSYSRSFPKVFDHAKGSLIYDEQNNRYIDFFAGAGTLNYGHNNPLLTNAMIDYLRRGGIVHGLDQATTCKREFMQKIHSTILEPRGMDYKIQFTGPTGTNAVETALKLARLAKGSSNIISFTNGFHGMTMGSLAVTGNDFYRDESHVNRDNVAFMPYDGYFGPKVDTSEYIRRFVEDKSSGVDDPAAVIVETVQGEGGINVASFDWLKKIHDLCREHEILMIVDDIQVGNGRTGSFFSFEKARIQPDIVTLSKSIGGGLPLSLVLIKPELDIWKPGEHTGTFRGNNLAFVAATKTLDYWQNDSFSKTIMQKSSIVRKRFNKIRDRHPQLDAQVRGRGMICGIDVKKPGFSEKVSKRAFEKGLVIELSGSESNVLKFLAPLTIEKDLLNEGLDILDECYDEIVKEDKP